MSLRPPPFVWTGGYVGLTAGAALGSYHPTIGTSGVGYLNAVQSGQVNASGVQSIKPTGFAAGVEAGYNWQTGRFVFGIEGDAQAVHLNGKSRSGGIPYFGAPGLFFVTHGYANSDALFTLRGRAGVVGFNDWLFYATGGLAVAQIDSDFFFADNNGALVSGRFNSWKPGYVVGGGVEAPLTDRLSVKAEYLYTHFDTASATITASNLAAAFPAQSFSETTNLSAHIARVGLNYRFGNWNNVGPFGTRPVVFPTKSPFTATDFEFEAGTRVWVSSGKAGAPQPLLGFPPPPSIAVSRLTFNELDAVSGEAFARVDHKSGVFVKGFLGGGGIHRGNLIDEDFPAFNAYSNTVSNASGHLAYANIDLGYAFLKTPAAKLGGFVGYNYYTQHINTYGCTQQAGDPVCAAGVPPAYPIITETDVYHSLRVGLSSQVMLTDRLKLTADAAYLPYVTFDGEDNHNARQFIGPETSHKGDGVMLETSLDYKVTEAWNVGIGGRYWAWNMRDGRAGFTFFDPAAPAATPQLARFTNERYGVFLQSSYHWGETVAVAAAVPGAMPVKATMKAPAAFASGPMNWTGVYIGGHLGGGRSSEEWADPFASTPGTGGFVNFAGFGDRTHAMGPLGGGQIGFDYQAGRWVFGVGADASVAHLRGENTCFSGLGGVNCQTVVNALGAATARVGYAWDRSLAYVKGGYAWVNSTYDVNGNTGALALGYGSTKVTAGGWTVGTGVEYALTNSWATFVEYDHIGLGNKAVAFPTVAVINAQPLTVRQSVDLIKLGVNYHFNVASLIPRP